MENERRRTPRYSFSGTAEIIADNPNASATATVRELSLRGCRLDMKNSFPVRMRADDVARGPEIARGAEAATIQWEALARWCERGGQFVQIRRDGGSASRLGLTGVASKSESSRAGWFHLPFASGLRFVQFDGGKAIPQNRG